MELVPPKTIEPVQSSDALTIHEPALALQQHPNALIPKPRSRMAQIPNADPQRGLILRTAPSILGGATESRKLTAPQATDLKRLVKPGGQFSTACGPQTFFRKASDSICLPSERSATNHFNRLFSSSTYRSRAVRSRSDGRTSFFRCRRWRHSPQAAGRGRRPECRLLPVRSRRRSVPRRISTRFMGPLLSCETTEAVSLL